MKFYRIFLFTIFTYTLISCGGAEERKSVYMEKAKSSIEAGDLDKARIELKNVLQIDPKDGEAYYQLATVLEDQKDYRKAFGMYLKAEELAPDLLENHARLGRFYLLLGNDTNKAQEKVDLILSKDASNAYGLLLKAAIMLRSGDSSGAITTAEKIDSSSPAYPEVVAFLSAIKMNDGKVGDAIRLLDSAIENNENNEKLNKLLAVALVKNKDFQRAEALYQKFLERNPDSISSYNNLASFYNEMGDKDKAEATLRSSIENNKSDVNRILTLSKFIKDSKGIGKAVNELKLSVSQNTGLGKLRLALAELHVLNNDIPSSVEVLKQTIKDFSEDEIGVSARMGLANIYLSDKHYDEAEKIISDALSISPNDPKVNFLRAKFAIRDKDWEKAVISLRIVTKEIPNNIEAYILLANVYQQIGNNEQAKSTLTSAYENNKANASGLLDLAQYHFDKDIVLAEKIIDRYNSIKVDDYKGLSVKSAILNKNKKFQEGYEVATILKEKYPEKANGYLQAIPQLSAENDIASAISLLELGYIKVKNNRKILKLLTSFQVREKQYDKAEKRLKEEINELPNDPQLKLLSAKVSMAKQDNASAISSLKEVLNIKPTSEEAYLLLAQMYQSDKNIKLVKEVLEKGIANVKGNIRIPLSLANIYEEEESYDKAIKVYQNLHSVHPENMIITNNLVSLLADFGDGKDDLKFAKDLAEKFKESDQSVFLDTYGWLFYKLGDSQTAIEYLKKAVDQTPNVNVFNYHLGMAYKLSGEKSKAKSFITKSLSDGNNFKERKDAEASLKDL